MKRLARAYQTVGLLLLNTLLLLLLVEGCARLALALRPPAPSLAQRVASFKEGMLRLSYYAGQEWARAYWDEHMAAAVNWTYEPYVLWHTQPFSGQYINIDAQGMRRTPGSTCTESSYRIFVFGGSTVWGYGVPDDNTLPAYLQAGLPHNVCVRNYGELGYNSTQSLLRLLRLLQAGDVPDMVLFVQGSNDVMVAQRTSSAGSAFYDAQMARAIDSSSGLIASDGAAANPLRDWLRSTATYRLLLGAPQTIEDAVWAQPPFDPAFVSGIVDTYLANWRAAQALADEYGFVFLAFTQPVLPLVGRPYTDEEQRFIWDTPGGLVELFRAVYPRIAAGLPAGRFYYWANVLDGQTLPMWIDFVHLTAWGNLALAAEILREIVPLAAP
ncbi:MAG: hypothetical protein HXY40_09355 [Chloroflexi bacterium]|nr:hypothetical protein [Chloroflexota bacterium]